MVKVAAVQEAPVCHDLEATLQTGVAILERAARAGIDLVAFPEAWFSGYPDFVWALAAGNDQDEAGKAFARFRANAVDLSRDGLAPIRKAAHEHGIVVVAGVTERAAEQSAGTLYNTAVTIDATGEILNMHRKVMPTMAERMVWGYGDASGLRVVDTAVGRVSVLLCWENFMPLARAAMWAQNVDIHVAPTADNSDQWLASMQHIGREGSCWVIGLDTPLHEDDIPADLPGRAQISLGPDTWCRIGSAIICDPYGGVAAGPMRREKGLLETDVDLEVVRQARQWFDVCGHYARPDLFSLNVDQSPQAPVRFADGS